MLSKIVNIRQKINNEKCEILGYKTISQDHTLSVALSQSNEHEYAHTLRVERC